MDVLATLPEHLVTPSDELVAFMDQLEGDLLILGVGGKMGVSLAETARRAWGRSDRRHRVIGVSRFGAGDARSRLEAAGVETVAADLLDPAAVAALPEAANVIYMAGRKFGTRGQEHLTWAMNVHVPALVAQRFRGARIVAFSTGNVYPLTPVAQGGATEQTPTGPVGEYGQSCLGRERIFEHFSRTLGVRVALLRLNYAIDLRYGILVEVAQAVREGRPIDLGMGHVNVIWQGDANEVAIRSLQWANSPPEVMNVTGPETVSIRWLAERFGELFGQQPRFTGTEGERAFLSNASLAHQRFGYPRVPLRQMILWTAQWLQAGGPVLDLPTHFQEREGNY